MLDTHRVANKYTKLCSHSSRSQSVRQYTQTDDHRSNIKIDNDDGVF